MSWTKKIPEKEIIDQITELSVEFAHEFGSYLGKKEEFTDRNGSRHVENKMTSTQIRKFFGEVKRQQMQGYNKSSFIMLKPKLAYAAARDDKKTKIKDFYFVIADAMDKVNDERSFNNFISIFEAIVAYHRAAEEGIGL